MNFKNQTEQFLAIIDNLDDGLMVFDKEDKLLLFNSSIKKFFEVKEEEVLGKTMADFSRIPVLKNLFYLLGEEIKEVSRKEFEFKDNLILEITTLPILSNGQKTGTLLIGHNVTREKTIERMKAEFVTIAAHQLRTPLSAVKWALERLLKEDWTDSVEDQKKIIKEALISSDRITVILNVFLNTARIEEGKYLGKLEFHNLEKIVQKVINSHQEAIEKKQIKFEFQTLSGKLPEVRIDPEMISLSVQSLLDNALRYTPLGGIISIALRQPSKGEIEFLIQDTGIGIPENQQQNVFKKFFRASNALKIETEGNGLSLFVVRNIIQAHNGKIWFESKEKEGTTFYFTLPLK